MAGEKTIRIGTRGSDLALWQAREIQSRLERMNVASELAIIKTQGDRQDTVPFSELEGKSFFTKEIEEALLDGRVDAAVHSLKDLATAMPVGLRIAALVGREDPSDLLVGLPKSWDREKEERGELFPLREEARVGTGAERRKAQLQDLRPDLTALDLRGNVPTRIRKLREGSYDAVILARAGVLRLGLDLANLHSRVLPLELFVPAPGQGMLAVQCRDEPFYVELLAPLHCRAEGICVEAERLLLSRLEGGCRLPFGVNIRPDKGIFRLSAFWQEAGSEAVRVELAGPDPGKLADKAFRIIRQLPEQGERTA